MITLRQRTLNVRTVTPADAPLLANLLAHLSDRTLQLRFFRVLKDIEQICDEAVRMATGAPQRHAVLVATVEEQSAERAVAVAELVHDPSDPAIAEFAVVVRDDYQHEGLGTIISRMLMQLAALRGVRTLRATMMAENRAVYRLVRGLGAPYTAQTHLGETTVQIGLAHS